MRGWAAGLVVVAIMGAGPAEPPASTTGEFPRSVQAVLDGAAEVEVLSLDPGVGASKPDGSGKPNDGFRGWKVLGRTTIKGDARKSLLQALGKGVGEADLAARAATGNFRHGLRASHGDKTVDLVISFEDGLIRMYLDDPTSGFTSVTVTPKAAFDKVLQDAKVPLAPAPDKK